MAKEMDFLRGVDKLHAFYTENVRMLAHAYDLSDEQASMLLDRMGFHNVARSILLPGRVDPIGDLARDTGKDDDAG
ncbi:hypothetical protein [Parenemella sanctibonifatiensis]|uniref:Uncharacterized protein n=1 Tax=Parenemella sanctibonifatiensis TaxID=2016505 RepID=A0A255ETA6_9ACTN|nr:hypothetical protein [Parenemella sanctibonifatiensis]OYN91353.1 hypothetical protein CGZ91_07965 [Parenemella sanctibonifatiensis]